MHTLMELGHCSTGKLKCHGENYGWRGGGLMFQHGGAPLHACISLSERVKASEH